MNDTKTAAEKAKCGKCISLAKKHGLAKVYCQECLKKANQRSKPTTTEKMTKEGFMEILFEHFEGKQEFGRLDSVGVDILWKAIQAHGEDCKREVLEEIRAQLNIRETKGLVVNMGDPMYTEAHDNGFNFLSRHLREFINNEIKNTKS